jgi:hypothetical protein
VVEWTFGFSAHKDLIEKMEIGLCVYEGKTVSVDGISIQAKKVMLRN